MRQTYYRIWKQFNQFFVKLDDKARSWSDCLVLFTGYLVDSKLQSATVKTYISAIKGVLVEIGIRLSPDKFLLTSLTKACHLKNDVAVQHFAIRKGMLKLMIDQLDNLYIGNTHKQQPYLCKLFKAIYSASYYGLLRISKVAKSQHAILTCNTHIAINKNKILFILSSFYHPKPTAKEINLSR